MAAKRTVCIFRIVMFVRLKKDQCNLEIIYWGKPEQSPH